MPPDLSLDRRTDRQRSADEAYCRLRTLLDLQPEVFVAAREGLAIAIDDFETHILRPGSDDALARSVVSATALVDGWLIRATYKYWLLLPMAFELDEDLPSGVLDHRWDSITNCWSREGRTGGRDVAASPLDAW